MKVELVGSVGRYRVARVDGRECFWPSSGGPAALRWADTGEPLSEEQINDVAVETRRVTEEHAARIARESFARAKADVEAEAPR